MYIRRGFNNQAKKCVAFHHELRSNPDRRSTSIGFAESFAKGTSDMFRQSADKPSVIRNFAGFLLAFFSLSTVWAETSTDKPNVLFLFADDMRADTIAALGDKVAKTPTLDALVQRGFTMKNAYCMGGNSGAVCTPSRNMMLSGNAFFRWKDFKPPQGQKGMISPGDGPNFHYPWPPQVTKRFTTASVAIQRL